MNDSKLKLDHAAVRHDFPILHQKINNHPFVYLDNAATTQKPQAVIDAIENYYLQINSNVHRGIHTLSVRSTNNFEATREKVKRFINAYATRECIFTKGTTDSINLVAQSFVAPTLQPDDEILITHMEHHSNIVPWQMICAQTGAKLSVVPISITGEILLDDFASLLSPKTKFVALNYVSNVLGTINPVKEMIKLAHAAGVKVLLDGAQATAHIPIDVQDLGCDFYALSAHKMFGPTGVGVLWGREELLDLMPPYQGGGEMVEQVSFEVATTYAALPHKFEAGTPNIAGVIGFGAAIDYLWSLDMNLIAEYEAELLEYATNALLAEKEFNIIGTAKHKVPVISFVHGKIHAHDIGSILDNQGIAIRSGHHCAMPLMDFYEISAASRISLAFYNTKNDIDLFIKALNKVKEVFA